VAFTGSATQQRQAAAAVAITITTCPIVTHSTTALPLIGIGEEDTLCTRASFKYDYYVLLQHHQVQNTNKLQHEQLQHSSLPSWTKMITSAAAATAPPAAFLDFRPMTVTAVQAIKVWRVMLHCRSATSTSMSKPQPLVIPSDAAEHATIADIINAELES